MIKKTHRFLCLGGLVLTIGLNSCVGDLNIEPQDETKKLTLDSAQEYLEELAGCYMGFSREDGITTGATGGEAVYSRMVWNLQELCSDEVIIANNWNDAGVDQLCYAVPASDNHWIYDLFSRINAIIAVNNQFIRDIDKAGKFFSDSEIAEMKAEAVVMRDLAYYNMIDLWGRGPWTDEHSTVGATPPTYDRQQLFDAIIEDLTTYVPLLNPASQQEYGRVSREAGYALLAKMYLNAEVYTGKGMWQQCADACMQIVNAGLKLAPTYKYLFCSTNDQHVACSTYDPTGELIWIIPQNDITMINWGGTTYLSLGAYSSILPQEERVKLGVTVDGWDGPHMRPETVDNFTDPNDERALFYTDGFVNDIADLNAWGKAGEDNGYMCIKYVYTPENDYYNETGLYTSGVAYNSTDYVVFRMADIYLMLTECAINGANVDGLKYFNEVRSRAGISTVTQLPSKKELLDERNRELYWEGHRRSDMIRLGYYTGGDYLWKWKGGVYEGTPIPSTRDLMPVPPQFVSTLGQNPGY